MESRLPQLHQRSSVQIAPKASVGFSFHKDSPIRKTGEFSPIKKSTSMNVKSFMKIANQNPPPPKIEANRSVMFSESERFTVFSCPFSIRNVEEFNNASELILSSIGQNTTVLLQLSRFFTHSDPSDPGVIKAADLVIRELIKKLFPHSKSKFRRILFYDLTFVFDNPNLSTLAPMYRMLKRMIDLFPQLDVFDITLIDTFFEYSNTTDMNERKILVELCNAFIRTHTEMIGDILKRIYSRLSLIIDRSENPMQTCALLNSFLCIISITSYLTEPGSLNKVASFIFPLMKLDSLTLYLIAYIKVVIFIVTSYSNYAHSFYVQLYKYWPKASGRKLTHFTQIIGHILKNSADGKSFMATFNKLRGRISFVFDSKFEPAIEVLIDLFDQTLKGDLAKEYGRELVSIVGRLEVTVKESRNPKAVEKAIDIIKRFESIPRPQDDSEERKAKSVQYRNNYIKNNWSYIASFVPDEKDKIDKFISTL